MKTDSQWEKIGKIPHHGICVPLFSLRTKKSCGIGEFNDLLPLIDWCQSLKLDCIQLLPLDDSGQDASPYNPLSSCALDPIYLSLSDLPNLSADLLLELQSFIPLTQTQRISRSEVKKKKLEWLKKYFESTSQDAGFKLFNENNTWLDPYGLFLTLKEENGGKYWHDWPEEYATFKPEHLEKRRRSIDFHCFVQFLCHSQMKKVRDYASEKEIFLVGDLSFLISPDSVDVWAERSLFNLNYAAGAPPDAYNPKGQKWGFPLFNWEEMREKDFAWWKRRLHLTEQFFHLYRMDHVVGFFRIWGIPPEKEPSEGQYFPSDRALWAKQGTELLNRMIEYSSILPIAEDLGTIPEEVYPILKQLGLCGTKVIRWQRSKQGDYIPYSEYEPLSLTTLSTPDMDLIETWWQKYPAEAVPFAKFKNWPYHPLLTHQQRLALLYDAHHTPSYFHINLLQEYLALFPSLVWPNPDEERINVPGTIAPTNWTYRFRPFLEEIVEHKGLADAFKQILN